ncbi:protein COFACTOR ASSEMBLY OF COMPLEX C SUBUNIT B CCB1, chloroplastic [Silene latifolia]|uniref:protein COFACTOR ASSEMBLY OF COMPLEX C SUBUNIT B CCB1, chloroplastic n=1 Tax=Silene latifolia TaxID=37657 RepID=UPI003D787D01
MAANLLSPPNPLSSFSSISILNPRKLHLHQLHTTIKPKNIPISASLQQIDITTQLASNLSDNLHQNANSLLLMTESVGYSPASYYTSLGLFVISVPGLWSLIKRSVKSKVVKKTFVEGEEKMKTPNQVAGEILSFFTRNNFVVSDRGETITFEGIMIPSRGQAALLTFCTCISLASVGLVLTITFPDVGNNWFWITALSPLAGAYYWKRASRKEQIKVKMIVGEDGKLSEIVVQGDDVQVEQLRKELQLNEKGMVYVKGLFERS